MTGENALAETLHGLDPNVFEAAERDAWRKMMAVDAQARTADAVRHETEAWRQVASVADWQRFRDRRLAALRRSLQPFPPDSLPLSIRVTGELDGDGYRLRKLVYETRPGVLVTAHLYLPDPLPESMPGIQICHAHHRPKDQAELQDMGVNWARTGAAVLVPDMVGYGERGEEPFGGRENYYARYYTAMHLHLVGESLIGWMAWDLIRGTDVLLDLPAIDEDRIVMIGAVAGGGDAAGVAAALDPRVACSIPFNFGGGSAWRADLPAPAPEGTNLAGAPYWETTRNLWLSTRDEFFPWLIVAAAAPRFLIYAHEFGWDAESDEAWHRMQKVYELYGASDRLGWMKGAGRCAPGEGNTHCTNVGPVHRGKLYPYLERWLGIEPPLPEVQDRRQPDELACLDDAAQARRRPLRETARETADALGARLREQLDGRPPEQKRALLRRKWADLLGDIKPRQPSSGEVRGETDLDGVAVRSLLLEVEPGITVPMRLFLPAAGAPPPVVVAVAHEGKAGFLDGRPGEIAGLLARGIAVCLADVRGTGETRADDMHGLESEFIDLSEQERMLGRNVLGLQVRDLLAVLRYLRTLPEIDGSRVGLWGDSFAPVNPPGFEPVEHDPSRVDHSDWPNQPHGPAIGEPVGQLLALFGALFDDGVEVVLGRRGLTGFISLLDHYYLYVPSDVVVPGALAAGDLADVIGALAPAPVRLQALIDGCNRPLDQAATDGALGTAADNLELVADETAGAVDWFADALAD